VAIRAYRCSAENASLRRLLGSAFVVLVMRDVRFGGLDAVIGLAGWPSSSAVLTWTYLLVVGTVAAIGLLRLHRVRSGGLGRVLVTFAVAAIVAALAGGWIGGGMFEAMTLLAWAVFVVAPLLFAGIASLRRHHRATFVVGWTAAFATLAVAVHAFVVEPRWLEITHVEHRSSSVDRELTIALVADLQTDAPGAYERHVLAEIAAARPDLVLWAGDYLQIDDPVEFDRALRQLREMIRESGLDPPLGMFAVAGNNETHASWPELFDDTGVVALPSTRRVVIAEDVTLTALGLHDSFDPGLKVEAAAGLHIVLGHAPDYALGEVDADLLLAGHTHGGQVRVPGFGPIITLSQVPRAWAAGVTRLDERRTLVVSRGIGMERGPAPRLRFHCRPELVFVHVRPA
jgi:uncharacterized protein